MLQGEDEAYVQFFAGQTGCTMPYRSVRLKSSAFIPATTGISWTMDDTFRDQMLEIGNTEEDIYWDFLRFAGMLKHKRSPAEILGGAGAQPAVKGESAVRLVYFQSEPRHFRIISVAKMT